MKTYHESIDKTIRNIDKLDEQTVANCLELHDDQWVAQEENWTTKDTRKATTLWNLLIEAVKARFPHLIGCDVE